MSKENRVFIISASDRYNFGDLLFNYIVDFFLSEYCKNKYEIIFTSLSGNDLQSVQGHKTVGLTKGLKRIGDGDVLIFAGGGVLGHKWAPMFLQAEGGKKIKKIKKLMPDWLFEGFIKLFYFKTKARYPYTRSINDFNKSVRVIYNSVGGGALNGMSSVETKRVLTRLKTASYISVRDQNIQNIISGIKSNLVPDSAILLSEKITKDELYSMAESNIKNILDQNYIILHFNKKISNRYFDEIQELITGIKNNFNFNIFLMPVNYIDNTDMEGMISHEKNRNCTVIKNKLKVFEICALIANSKLMIGSSLHTNIIACSYGVPHLGATHSVSKVNNFFKTWYPSDSVFNSYDLKKILEIIPNALDNKSEVKKNSERLKLVAIDNFNKINQIMEREANPPEK